MVLLRDKASGDIQYHCHRSCIARTLAKVDSHTSSLSPFGTFVTGLHPRIKDIDWTTKSMKMFAVGSDRNPRKLFERSCSCFEARSVVVNIGGQADSIGPKMMINCVGPSALSMQNHCSCAILKIPNSLFSDAVLVMGSNTTERLSLSLFVNVMSPQGVMEATIVSVVMDNGHLVLAGEILEGMFGL